MNSGFFPRQNSRGGVTPERARELQENARQRQADREEVERQAKLKRAEMAPPRLPFSHLSWHG